MLLIHLAVLPALLSSSPLPPPPPTLAATSFTTEEEWWPMVQPGCKHPVHHSKRSALVTLLMISDGSYVYVLVFPENVRTHCDPVALCEPVFYCWRDATSRLELPRLLC